MTQKIPNTYCPNCIHISFKILGLEKSGNKYCQRNEFLKNRNSFKLKKKKKRLPIVIGSMSWEGRTLQVNTSNISPGEGIIDSACSPDRWSFRLCLNNSKMLGTYHICIVHSPRSKDLQKRDSNEGPHFGRLADMICFGLVTETLEPFRLHLSINYLLSFSPRLAPNSQTPIISTSELKETLGVTESLS